MVLQKLVSRLSYEEAKHRFKKEVANEYMAMSMKMGNGRTISIAFMLFGACVGCRSSAPFLETTHLFDDPVNIVKDGVLTTHNTTTVGKAFEGTFQNAQWKSFETPKGETVVEFDGTVAPRVLRSRFPNADLFISIRDSCIESLDIKEKMAQEETASRQSSFEFFTTHAMENGTNWDVVVSNVSNNLLDGLSELQIVRARELIAERALAADNEAKIDSCLKAHPIPVKFQFVLTADKKSFKIAYFDDKSFGWGASLDAVLAFIYE